MNLIAVPWYGACFLFLSSVFFFASEPTEQGPLCQAPSGRVRPETPKRRPADQPWPEGEDRSQLERRGPAAVANDSPS
jgi:hypothetical protein